MTYFKSTNKENAYAAILNGEIFIIANGEIIKNYPLKNLPSYYESVPEIPFNFEILLSSYSEKQNAKAAQRKAEADARALTAYEERKEQILNLRKWRRGEVEAFILSTCFEYNNERNFSPFGFENKLIFGEEEAYAAYEAAKGSDLPDENEQYFVTELNSVYKPFTEEERLEITIIADLQEAMMQRLDIIERDTYATSIEDCDYVVTKNKSTLTIEERRTWSGWIGNSFYTEQKTTADLGKDQYAVKEADLYDFDYQNGLFTQALKDGLLNKETAKEYMGDSDVAFYFSEEEKEEDND